MQSSADHSEEMRNVINSGPIKFFQVEEIETFPVEIQYCERKMYQFGIAGVKQKREEKMEGMM